jgi:hypothetical protein
MDFVNRVVPLILIRKPDHLTHFPFQKFVVTGEKQASLFTSKHEQGCCDNPPKKKYRTIA